MTRADPAYAAGYLEGRAMAITRRWTEPQIRDALRQWADIKPSCWLDARRLEEIHGVMDALADLLPRLEIIYASPRS